MTRKVSACVTFALYVKLFLAGMGRHIYCLSIGQILDLVKWALLSQIGILITLGLMKILVCHFVLRVVDKAWKGIAKAIWFLIYFVALTQCYLMAMDRCYHLEGILVQSRRDRSLLYVTKTNCFT